LPCFFSSAGSLRTHSIAWGWQAIPILEHAIFPPSRWQMTQRSVHAAHPGGCAWTGGSFGGTGDFAGASGTISADGSVWSGAQLAGAGGSAACAARVAVTAATIMNKPQQMRRRRTNNEGNMIVFALSQSNGGARTPTCPNWVVEGFCSTERFIERLIPAFSKNSDKEKALQIPGINGWEITMDENKVTVADAALGATLA
jgi:hypothetical protein